MLKASALYLVIIIALVIGLLCSSLILTAYYYKLQYQKKFRFDRLQNNIASGVNIILGSETATYHTEKAFALFGTDEDSVSLKRMPWGIYDVGMCRAYIQHDTLYKTFTIASSIDSTKWGALYLIDEDRPLSVSGNTMIRGNAFIPKAGVKEAYVDGKAYSGDKRLVIGKIHDSQKTLPALQAVRISILEKLKTQTNKADSVIRSNDSLIVSFLNTTKVINFKKKVQTFSHIKLSGNIILLSDTAITIENDVLLENIIVLAKSITVKQGFKGNAQLFATDSIGIEKNCTFNYPSCLGILRFTNDKSIQGKIRLGENTVMNGAIFTYEKEKSTLQTLVNIGNHAKVCGQVYVQGLLKFNRDGQINGSAFTNRFLYKTSYTTYENYLISVKLDAKGLSPYYLTSPLFPVSDSNQKVLQWLESN